MVDVREIVAELGGEEVFGTAITEDGQLRREIERGFPPAAANALRRSLPKTVRIRVLPSSSRVSSHRSEGIEGVARLLARAKEVWNGNEEGAISFLTTPHRLLDDESRIQVARTEVGARQVERLLATLGLGTTVVLNVVHRDSPWIVLGEPLPFGWDERLFV